MATINPNVQPAIRIMIAEPNWQLLGDVVRRLLVKTTADYLNRKDA